MPPIRTAAATRIGVASAARAARWACRAARSSGAAAPPLKIAVTTTPSRSADGTHSVTATAASAPQSRASAAKSAAEIARSKAAEVAGAFQRMSPGSSAGAPPKAGVTLNTRRSPGTAPDIWRIAFAPGAGSPAPWR